MKKIYKRNQRLFFKTYKKYGTTGIILLFLSIMSILIGLFILIEFFVKISDSASIIHSNEDFDKELTGIVGDFVGGVVGTLWSLTGVILFFLALRLQSKELSLQIQEMRETRNVFQLQQFESTFFNLIKTHNEIRDSIKIDKNKTISFGKQEILSGNEGLQAVKDFILEEKKQLERNLDLMKANLNQENEERFQQFYNITYDEFLSKKNISSKILYKDVFLRYYNELSHYFRNLYHILLFIKENEELEILEAIHNSVTGDKNTISINGKNVDEQRIKRKYLKYSQFLQAQMSNSELFLTFYNALFFPKLKVLVQYYDLLQNLNKDDLIYVDSDEQLYGEYIYKMQKIPALKLRNKDEILKI